MLVSSRTKRPSELDRLAEQVRALWRKALTIPVYAGKRQDVQKPVQESVEEFGRVDILVNNAGVN